MIKKKFNEFVNMEVGLDLTNNNEQQEITINESKSPEELRKATQTIGLDLTKNLSKTIDLI